MHSESTCRSEAAALVQAATEERWSAVAALVNKSFFSLSFTFPAAVREVFDRAPVDWLRQHPRFLMMAALARSTAKSGTIIGYDTLASYSDWVESQPVPATRDVVGLSSARAADLMVADRFEEACAITKQLLTTIDSAPDAAGFDDILPPVCIGAGVINLQVGNVDAAAEFFFRAQKWAAASGHPALPLASNYLAIAESLSDNIFSAEALLVPVGERTAEGTPWYLHQAAETIATALIGLGRLDRSATATALASLKDSDIAGDLANVVGHARAKYALFWGDRPRMIRELEAKLRVQPPSAHSGVLAWARSDLMNLYQAEGLYSAAEDVFNSAVASPTDSVTLGSAVRGDILKGRSAEAARRLADYPGISTRRDNLPLLLAALHAGVSNAPDSVFEALGVKIVTAGSMAVLAELTPQLQERILNFVEIDRDSLPRVFGAALRIQLTARENEIFGLLARNLSYAEMAAELHLSQNTVKSHLRKLYGKLGVHKRAEALAYVRSRGNSPAR